MLFDGWYGLLRVVVVGAVAYGSLILMLRASGKRALSKMNAFDLVVTVALGSTLATVLLTDTVALVEGLVAMALLIGLQFLVGWSSVRWKRVGRIVKSSPRLLYYRGELIQAALREERITEAEVLASVRERGFASLSQVEAVVLENAGELSVIEKVGAGSEDEMAALRR